MRQEKLTIKLNHNQAFFLLKAMELNTPICNSLEELMLLQEPKFKLRAKFLGMSTNVTQATLDIGQVAVLAVMFRSPSLENEPFVIDIRIAVNDWIGQKFLKPVVRQAH